MNCGKNWSGFLPIQLSVESQTASSAKNFLLHNKLAFARARFQPPTVSARSQTPRDISPSAPRWSLGGALTSPTVGWFRPPPPLLRPLQIFQAWVFLGRGLREFQKLFRRCILSGKSSLELIFNWGEHASPHTLFGGVTNFSGTTGQPLALFLAPPPQIHPF